jgi:hypothetical protein
MPAGHGMISDYFVCVGAQKAGTSWLLHALNQHPDIFATPIKEIHYFDHVHGITSHLSRRKQRSRFRRYVQHLAFEWRRFGDYQSQWGWYRAYMRSPINDDWYRSLFADRDGARLAGEATPEYALLSRDGLQHIKRLAPEAKVIFIMRNPVDQAWSQYLHFEHKRDDRRAGSGNENAIRFWASPYSARTRAYPQTIDDLLAVFGPERTKFLFYEDIHADRLTVMERLCSFLGVKFSAAHFVNLEQRQNVSRPASIPPELRKHLIEQHRKVVREVRDRLGAIPLAWTDTFSMEAPPSRAASGGRSPAIAGFGRPRTFNTGQLYRPCSDAIKNRTLVRAAGTGSMVMRGSIAVEYADSGARRSTPEDVVQSFLTSIDKAERHEEPYRYWILRDCLPADAVGAILALPFPPPDLHGISGKRELHNNTREYFDAENRELYPVCGIVADAFQDKRVTDRIVEAFATNLDGTYLRIEFAQDTDGFWLEPHTDLGVKLFTMLLYMSKAEGHRNLGTDIYDRDKRHVGRSPFGSNVAMVFIPSDITYHGFEQRPIQGVRKSVIINYVSDGWRAREQLAFPDRPIR